MSHCEDSGSMGKEGWWPLAAESSSEVTDCRKRGPRGYNFREVDSPTIM